MYHQPPEQCLIYWGSAAHGWVSSVQLLSLFCSSPPGLITQLVLLRAGALGSVCLGPWRRWLQTLPRSASHVAAISCVAELLQEEKL